MNLQGAGVAGLPEALDSPGVAKEMGVNPFGDPGPLGGCLDNRPGSLAVDLEDAVIEPQFSVKGEALEAMGQVFGTGYQARFAAFTQDIEHGALLLDADTAGGQAYAFGDAHSGLEEGVDQELIPEPVAPLAGSRQASHFLPGQVGDYTQDWREQSPAGDEGSLIHGKLDKSLFGPILLLVGCGCQAQNAGKRQEDAELDKSASFV